MVRADRNRAPGSGSGDAERGRAAVSLVWSLSSRVSSRATRWRTLRLGCGRTEGKASEGRGGRDSGEGKADVSKRSSLTAAARTGRGLKPSGGNGPVGYSPRPDREGQSWETPPPTWRLAIGGRTRRASNTADSGVTAHARTRTHGAGGVLSKARDSFPPHRTLGLCATPSIHPLHRRLVTWVAQSEGEGVSVCCEPWPARRRCLASRRSPSTTSPRTAGSSSTARCMMSLLSWRSILVEMRYC